MTKTLMIVDDVAVIRMMLKKILQNNGYRVVAEAGDGAEAIKRYMEFKPDLVTMDLTMPDKDGIETMQEILRFDHNAKIVMVSAVDQQDSLVRAIKSGAVDYIIKPFEADRVISAVQKAIG